ncbi:GNVR domain-containing protein [Candidatus Omnitrophota bacterium]
MEEKPNIEWQDYLKMILRRKALFIIPLVVTFILTIMLSFVVPPTYEAKAIILVEEEKMVNPLLSNLAVSTSVAGRLHRLREEILSWPRLLQLVEELKLNKTAGSALEIENLIQSIRKKIKLQMSGKDVIVITYQDQDPKITQEVVNTLCDILIRKNILAQSEEADSAITFIEEQLSLYKTKLEDSEAALRKFKETYGLQMPLATKINDELATLEAELTSALVDCTEEHPRVIELRRRMFSLKQKRIEQIQAAASKMEVEDYKDYIAIAESIPKQQQELTRLTRDTSVSEEIYAMLSEKLETARISKQLESSENKTKFKIIEPARLPLKPKKPNKLTFNFMGLLIGGMFGVGSVYLVELADKSFKNVEDLKSAFKLPVLGLIPKIITEEDINRIKANKKRMMILVSIITIFLIIIAFIISKVVY